MDWWKSVIWRIWDKSKALSIWSPIRKIKHMFNLLYLLIFPRSTITSEDLFLHLQSFKYVTAQTGVFWDFLWHKNFIFMNCETYLTSECSLRPPWPTAFEKSKIHQPNLEKLWFKGSKIEAFLLDFQHFPSKSSKNA